MICLIKSQKVNNNLLGLFAKAMIPPSCIPQASVRRATTAQRDPASFVCTAGYYCPVGSPTPTPCPAMTYSNLTGLHNASQCLDCTPGGLGLGFRLGWAVLKL